MNQDSLAFVRDQTRLQPAPFVPEISLHLASEVTPLWMATETWSGQKNSAPPFWAFAWPGGMALARYILDHPDVVRGLSVLDFAAGSGIGAIAAAKAGASRVAAADIDPLAQTAAQMNAARNGIAIDCWRGVDLEVPCRSFDLIIAGDVCYEQVMSSRILKWLALSAEAGAQVLLADPGRAYAPKEEALAALSVRADYEVPVLRELEDKETRHVTIWGFR